MKMSKSIKDYKDAMDSVKISDSFYKRTELLLSESSDIEMEKISVTQRRTAFRAVMGIAACLLIAFGAKTVIDNRSGQIETVTEIIEIETETETVAETAPAIIDRIDGNDSFVNDSGVIIDDMPEIPSTTEAAPAEEEGNQEETENSFTANPTASSENAEEEVSADYDDDVPTVDDNEIETETTTTAATTPKEGYPEMAEPQGMENIMPLADAAVDSVFVEITPYFDIGTIKSGETTVTGYGTDYSDIISQLAAITESSRQITNYSFTSVFSIQLSDAESGITLYSIYVTELNTVIVTKHDIADQKRTTYGVTATDYEILLRTLYNQFGNEAEYPFFRNLISGK